MPECHKHSVTRNVCAIGEVALLDFVSNFVNTVLNFVVELLKSAVELASFLLRSLEAGAVAVSALSQPPSQDLLEMPALSFETLKLCILQIIFIHIIGLSHVEPHHLERFALAIWIDLLAVFVENRLKDLLVYFGSKTINLDGEVRRAGGYAIGPQS